MATCIRCKCHYREPEDEQGDHDCPGCGLTPEDRERTSWVYGLDDEAKAAHRGLTGE